MENGLEPLSTGEDTVPGALWVKERVASDEMGGWAGEGLAGQAKALGLDPESRGSLLPYLALAKLSDIMDVGVL